MQEPIPRRPAPGAPLPPPTSTSHHLPAPHTVFAWKPRRGVQAPPVPVRPPRKPSCPARQVKTRASLPPASGHGRVTPSLRPGCRRFWTPSREPQGLAGAPSSRGTCSDQRTQGAGGSTVSGPSALSPRSADPRESGLWLEKPREGLPLGRLEPR